MKTTIFFPTLFAALALTACGNDETVNEGGANERVPLQVTGGIQTRAIGNNWQAGDGIGIYMYKAGTTTVSETTENRKYTTADGNGAFTADAANTVYFPVDGSEVDFYAYYPYRASFNDNGEATFDVSDQTRQPEFDLMTAKLSSTESAPLDKNHAAVALKFQHRMTKIELNIAAGTGLAASDLEGLTVEITKQRTEGLFDPEFDATGLNLTEPKTVTMLTAADGLTSSAILLPCGMEGSSDNVVIPGRQLVFTLNATGEKFYYAIPDTKAFNEGDRNIYNITINRTSLTVIASMEDWNSGNGNGDDGSAE